jgi:hypothetical protein
MNALQAVVTVCVSVLLVLIAIGIQGLQGFRRGSSNGITTGSVDE